MIDSYNEIKWNCFESSGKIADYLDFKGISAKKISDIKGELIHASDAEGTCGIGTQRG